MRKAPSFTGMRDPSYDGLSHFKVAAVLYAHSQAIFVNTKTNLIDRLCDFIFFAYTISEKKSKLLDVSFT